MKTTKKILSLVLALSLVLSMFMTGNSDAKAKIKLNKKKITMTVGQKYKLKLKNYKKKVKWTSFKKSTATVHKNGVVTAKKKGSVKITALAGKKKYVCKVTVKARKSTPANTPSIASSVPVVVPTEKSGVSQTVTPSIAPSSIPSTEPTTTPSATHEMEDVPKFITFKTYDDEEVFVDESGMTTQELDDQILVANAASETAETETKSIENNWINKEDILLLKLSYENKKRDSIVEIVLNDSDYGKKQIYTTAASINKILSSDTYYDEEKDSYVTDVLLQMPVTKSSTERNIEIQETCFLRETIGKKGYADMSSARRTAVKFNVSQETLPSCPIYFNFTENEVGGYTVVSWNQNYTLPDTLYIPPTYKGKPVNQIGPGAFEKATIKKLIIAESISEIGNNMTGMNRAPNLNSIVMLGMPSKFGGLSLTEDQSNGGLKIYVPYKYAPDYKWYKRSEWNHYIEYLYYKDIDGTIKPLSDYIGIEVVPKTFTYEGLDISWIDKDKPVVAFTFDDGPCGTEEGSTSMAIQEALTEANAHATFFYIGSRIDENGKAEIKSALERGFEIANHSYGFNSLSNGSSPEVIMDSVGKTNALLTELSGYSNFLFRAPNLSVNKDMQAYIEAPFIDISIDSRDWANGSTTEKIIENVKRAKDGDIVFMHATCSNTAEALPTLLKYFKDNGFQVVSVSELFAIKGKELKTSKIYSSAKE